MKRSESEPPEYFNQESKIRKLDQDIKPSAYESGLMMNSSTPPQMVQNAGMAPPPTGTPSSATSEDVEHERANKQKHAMNFLYKVRDHYASNPNTYNEFLEIMKGFKSGSIETAEVIERVKELFKGNDFLIEEFNLFLPPGYKIEPEPAAPPPTDLTPPQNSQADLDQARNYVRKIKNRFVMSPNIYKTFLEILHGYYQGQHQIVDVLNEVRELFKNHSDLFEEFTHFLPKSVSGRSTPVPASSTPLAQSVKKFKPEKKKPEKKALGFPEKPEKPELVRITERSDRYERRDRLVAGKKDEKRPEPSQNETAKMLRKQEKRKSERAAELEKNYYKEFNFFCEVKQRLNSKYLYHELLNCINLFSQEVISKPELMLLANDILSAHKDLYDDFKQFIGYEESEVPERKQIEVRREPQPYRLIPRDDIAELEMLIDMNESTMHALEALIETAERTNSQVTLTNLSVVHIRNIEMIYGNRGSEVVDALFDNPPVAVPVVLTRLKKKQEEWTLLVQSKKTSKEAKQKSVDL